MLRVPQHERNFDAELQHAADHGAPRQRVRERRAAQAHPEDDQRRDHGRAPKNRRDVADEELPVRVQDPQRPRIEHEQSDARKDDAREADRHLHHRRLEAADGDRENLRREDHAEDHQHGDDQQ
jgi:hypothetical protein